MSSADEITGSGEKPVKPKGLKKPEKSEKLKISKAAAKIHADANVFSTHPIAVHLVDREFHITRSLLFLGQVPKSVAAAAREFLNSNAGGETKGGARKVLVDFYGSLTDFEFLQTLTSDAPASPEIFGGGLEDLHSLLLPEASEGLTPKVKPTIRVAKPDQPVAQPKAPAPRVAVEVVTDLHLYPEDRVADLKDKLSVVAPNLPPFKQHMFIFGLASATRRYVPMAYRIMLEGQLTIDLTSAFTTPGTTQIAGFPVDVDLYQNRDGVVVEAQDYFTTLSQVYTRWNTRHFFVANIDDYVSAQSQQLAEMITVDSYQFQLIYYSFILKFWPLLSLEAFQLYLQKPAEFADFYPDLSQSPEVLRARFAQERHVLDRKYELMSDTPADFAKLLANTKVAVKNATLSVHREAHSISHQIRLNIRNLFEELHAAPELPYIRVCLRSEANQRLVWLTRIKSPNLIDTDPNDIQRIYERVKHRLQLNQPGSILLVIPVTPTLFLILTIFANGRYNVKNAWGEEIQMEFRDLMEMIQQHINPVIEYINSLQRGIFENAERLPLVTPHGSEFSNLSLSLFWPATSTAAQFTNLKSIFQSHIEAGLVRSVIVTGNARPQADGQSYQYGFIKGITEYDLSELEPGLGLTNFYEYFTSAKFKQRWSQLFAQGRFFAVTHRTTDVKVEIDDIRNSEFLYFYQYITAVLYDWGQHRTEGESRAAKLRALVGDHRRTNLLRTLKSRDPELYSFKRFGSDVVYSRICQKRSQPVPYDESEFNNLSAAERARAVKYWNFTTSSPMWYSCPDPKFPHLKFLVGHHPRGYCLPCCKKTGAIGDTEDRQSKRDHVYNICLQQHVYTDENSLGSSSRYIMNYGKPIDVGRIGGLPDIISKYLLYNLEDRELAAPEGRIAALGGKRISVTAALKVSRHSKVKEIPVADLAHFLDEAGHLVGSRLTPAQVLADPKLSIDDYNQMSNADVVHPLLLVHAPEGDRLLLVDGIYRLMKAKTVGDDLIRARVISWQQLLKAEQTRNEVGLERAKQQRENMMRRPGFYSFGVSQSNLHLNNLGAGYAIAAALSMSFPEFIEKLITLLSSGPQKSQKWFGLVCDGQLARHFDSAEQFLAVLMELFVLEELTLAGYQHKFTAWNELFIEFAAKYFGKTTIIFDDGSVDVTGTSMKSTRSGHDKISLVLPGKPRNAADVLREDGEYILLVRKKKKSKALFSVNHVYYPIFLVIPQVFFKNFGTEKRIFTIHDEIMKLVAALVENAFSQQGYEFSSPDLITLRNLVAARGKGARVARYFVDSRGQCYAVGLELAGRVAIWPIQRVSILTRPEDHVAATYRRSEVTVGFEQLLDLCIDYNQQLILDAETRGAYRVSPTESDYALPWNKREARVTTSRPLIKIGQFLSLGSDLIGFAAGNFHYYFKPIRIAREVEYARILAKCAQTRGYSMLVAGFSKSPVGNSLRRLRYDPDRINAALGRAPIELVPRKLYTAYYHRYLYNLFVIEIINHLDSERNSEIRGKLRRLLREGPMSMTGVKPGARREAISELVGPEEAALVAELASDPAELEARVFDFDRRTLNHWNKLTEGYEIQPPETRRKVHQQLVAEITKIATRICQIGASSAGSAESEFPNIFVPCEASASKSYCGSRGRLVVPRAVLPDLADLLAAEICSPLKRQFLLSATLLSNVRDEFRFSTNPGEEIYVSDAK
jgi:hypothetical protein